MCNCAKKMKRDKVRENNNRKYRQQHIIISRLAQRTIENCPNNRHKYGEKTLIVVPWGNFTVTDTRHRRKRVVEGSEVNLFPAVVSFITKGPLMSLSNQLVAPTSRLYFPTKTQKQPMIWHENNIKRSSLAHTTIDWVCPLFMKSSMRSSVSRSSEYKIFFNFSNRTNFKKRSS